MATYLESGATSAYEPARLAPMVFTR